MIKVIKYVNGRGFTDKLYFANLCFAWIYTLLCLILSVIGGFDNYSFVDIVCPLIWGEVTVHTGLVVWKAKVENLSKWAGNDVAKNASMNINMDI